MSKKTSKTPPYADAERCIAIRKRSKQGLANSQEDSEFCMEMWQLYPQWYEETEVRVFNETVPFGSGAKR